MFKKIIYFLKGIYQISQKGVKSEWEQVYIINKGQGTNLHTSLKKEKRRGFM